MNETEAILDLEIDASAAAAGAERFDQAVDGVASSAGRAAAAADKAEAAMDGMGRAAVDDAAAFDRMRAAADPLTATTIRMVDTNTRAERALERVRAQADPLWAAQQRLTRQTATLDQAFRAGLLTEEEKARTLAQLQARYDGLAERTRGATVAQTSFAASNDNATRSSGRMGGVMQQVGYQVGDMATQISMGGNAITAMTVQGAQLLGVLGPMGAIAGAAVAVFGALAAGLFKAGDASDDAASAQDRLNKAMETGKRIAQELEKAGVERTKSLQAETRWLVSKTDAEIKAMEARLNPLLAARQVLPSGLGGDPMGGAIASLFGFGPDAEIDKITPALREARKELHALRAGLGDYADGRSRYFEDGERLVTITDAGTVSLSRYREEQELELKLARMRRDEREVATAQLEAEKKVREAMVGKDPAAVDAEVARARDTAAAIVKSRQEIQEAERAASSAGRDADREREKAAKDWLGVLRTVAAQQERSDAAKSKASASIDDQIQAIRNETAQIGMTNLEREISVELLKAEETARRGGTKVTDDQAAALRREAAARYERRDAAQLEKKALEDATRQAERATDRVVEYAGDSFEEYPPEVLADPGIGNSLAEILA